MGGEREKERRSGEESKQEMKGGEGEMERWREKLSE